MKSRITRALSKSRRLLAALGAFLLGDRALLRRHGPSAIARAFGLRVLRYRPHPYMLYELNPEWRSADGKSRHNSLGFRGAEVQVAKPVGRLRVVCMGESTTYCTGIDDDTQTYPARLEAQLRKAKQGLDIEVINGGVGGYTSAENVLRCLFHVTPLAPDLIVYYYTHNDVHPRRLPSLSRDYREYSRSWYEPHSGGSFLRRGFARHVALASGDIGNVVRRYDEYVGQRPAANVLKNPPDAFEGNMSALALIARASGARVLFVNPPYRDLHLFGDGDVAKANPVSRAVWEHRNILEKIAATHGCAVYDLAREMPYPQDRNAFPNEHYLDPVHVNEKGADRMGALIAHAILSLDLLNARTQ